MLRSFQLKHLLFRVASVLLLTSITGFFLTPEPSTYTLSKTFIKSHAPSVSGYLFSTSSDDREDTDEDASVDVNIPSDLSAASIVRVLFHDSHLILGDPYMNLLVTEVYLIHRQLLI